MSKKLVAIHNYTDKTVFLDSRVSEKHRALGWQNSYGPKRKVEFYNDPNTAIPDNSDSAKYFETHRVHVYIGSTPQTASVSDFSYWNDDWDNYKIKYCRRENWKDGTEVMPGGEQGGDGSKIILHVSEPRKGEYQLAALAVEDLGKVKTANALKNFKAATGMRAGEKYTHQQLRKFMEHPSFGQVMDDARDNSYKSIALVMGGAGGLIVGGEAFSGVLMGLDGGGTYFLKSEAVSLGAQEGGYAFIGVYGSTEEPSKVGGLEFYAEVALGLDVGIAYSMFVTLSSNTGFFVALTNGEEVELTVGVGYVSTAQIA